MSTLAARIVGTSAFQRLVVAVIVLAGILSGVETSSALVERHRTLLAVLDAMVLGIFAVEAALKMAAHGRQPWRYFADGWNVFDFAVLVVCLIPVGGPFAAVLRMARALRLLRLVSALPKLQLLVGALLKSLSALGYVGLLLALLFYIYAVAGVHFFGTHDPVHFGTLSAALFSLFRVVTLDNWTDIYAAQLGAAPALKAVAYFVSFILFGTMIMLNLFIGIVMNSMAEMHEEISERDRARNVRETGLPSLGDELLVLERDLKAMQARLASLRRNHPQPRSSATHLHGTRAGSTPALST